MAFKQTNVDGNQTSICRAIGNDVSSTMGAGIETLERVSIEWTVTYDEILFIKEGEVFINSEGKRRRCVVGDIVWLPNGVSLVYEVPDKCTYFYALYPVDWAKRQGVAEP
jgi:ethanolamine utilization protein EutQ (cupin superfamily)